MRRRIVTLVICLLLGAIANIAVACGAALAISVRGNGPDIGSISEEQEYWHEHAPAELRDFTFRSGTQPFSTQGFGYFNTTWLALRRNPGQRASTAQHVSVHAGWPALSLRGEQWSFYNGFLGVFVPVRNDGVYDMNNGRETLLPLIPTWPGFAINTLFYAAILWLLFAAPFALRRWRRIKPACARRVRIPSAPATSAPSAASR